MSRLLNCAAAITYLFKPRK